MAALEREKEREERRRIELEELRVQEEQAAEDRRKAEEEARQKAEGLYTQNDPNNNAHSMQHIYVCLQRKPRSWKRYGNRRKRNGRWHYLVNYLALVRLPWEDLVNPRLIQLTPMPRECSVFIV